VHGVNTRFYIIVQYISLFVNIVLYSLARTESFHEKGALLKIWFLVRRLFEGLWGTYFSWLAAGTIVGFSLKISL